MVLIFWFRTKLGSQWSYFLPIVLIDHLKNEAEPIFIIDVLEENGVGYT